MKTQPLTDPKVGMFVFRETPCIMAKVTPVLPDGFRFYCLNGRWNGILEPGRIQVQALTETRIVETQDPFVQVTRVTRDESFEYYMRAEDGLDRLLEGKPFDDRDMLDQVLVEKQLGGRPFEVEARRFLRERGLEGAFGDWLMKAPVAEPDADLEPAF